MKTLIIDDSRAMRRILRQIVEPLGFQVTEAGDGIEGLNRLVEMGHVDVVFVDWNMPVMDGLQFLRELRRQPGGGAPKVIFCTTENDVAHIARAVNAGADEYIMKPFDREIMHSKFQEIGLC